MATCALLIKGCFGASGVSQKKKVVLFGLAVWCGVYARTTMD